MGKLFARLGSVVATVVLAPGSFFLLGPFLRPFLPAVVMEWIAVYKVPLLAALIIAICMAAVVAIGVRAFKQAVAFTLELELR